MQAGCQQDTALAVSWRPASPACVDDTGSSPSAVHAGCLLPGCRLCGDTETPLQQHHCMWYGKEAAACTLLTIRHIVQAGLGASGRSTAMRPQQRAHMPSRPQLLGSFRSAGQQEGQGVVGRHLCRLLHRLQALHDSKRADERAREGACMRGRVAQPVPVPA